MPVPDRVYVAVGYHLCSTTMIVGTDGVIIDPGENDTSAAEAMTDLRKFSDLPVRAVIYTATPTTASPSRASASPGTTSPAAGST